MKKLADGTQVSSGSYGLVQNFIDNDTKNTIKGLWGVNEITQLNKLQYKYLFELAVKTEMKSLEN